MRYFYRCFLLVLSVFVPNVVLAVGSDFNMASQLLTAARNGNIGLVQNLINSGADVNYIDSTGLSVVCTAVMNNDISAVQILQQYGADASGCDKQIKKYKNRNVPESTSGFWTGLSSTQSIALSSVGVAGVVGGLLLLTDVFDSDNNNGGSSSGNRGDDDPGQNPGTGGGTAGLKIPYGPAFLNATGGINLNSYQEIYADNLMGWDTRSTNGIRVDDFNYFRPVQSPTHNFNTDGINVFVENYLLLMHGYSLFASGYMGQTTFRKGVDDGYTPIKLLNSTGGGKPVSVGIITNNGVNPVGSLERADGIAYADSAAADSNTYTVDKFANFVSPVNNVLGQEKENFDLSGSGTAMNPWASATDTALGKIIAGWEGDERALGDFYGFVPNGVLAVYRTGNGTEWRDSSDHTVKASLTKRTGNDDTTMVQVGDTIEFGDKEYAISLAKDSMVSNPEIQISETKYKVAKSGDLLLGTADDGDCISLYLGLDGLYYFNVSGGTTADAVYKLEGHNFKNWKDLVANSVDVKNFEAMYMARDNNVIANLSLNPAARGVSYLSLKDVEPAFKELIADDDNVKNYVEAFQHFIDLYYDFNDNDSSKTQAGYANSLFNSYNSNSSIIVMPAGEFAYGQGDNKSYSVLDAQFENYAPVLYDNNLNHLFMTVVAVQRGISSMDESKNMTSAETISEYDNGTAYNKLALSKWKIDDDNVFSSRRCGIAGVGTGGVDPWCFAAAGPTTEMATASAAGAVAALKGAFPYMSNSQIFTLLAVTADGPWLSVDVNGNSWKKEDMVAYLRSMYSLPAEEFEDTLSVDEYVNAFKKVFGYGLINVERAITPGKSVYFYDGNKIVSTSGNAYWRAANATKLMLGGAFSGKNHLVHNSVFDSVGDIDGEVVVPRVWKNDFSFGVQNANGFCVDDVLADLYTRKENKNVVMFNDMELKISTSDKQYDDGMGGIDELRMNYAGNDMFFFADFQHHLTDGVPRFTGAAHPVLSMVSYAVDSGFGYNVGNWILGGRSFYGTITDEMLLETDPMISSRFEPEKLGLAYGGQFDVAWNLDNFGFSTDVGLFNEQNTLLGTYGSGLLDFGGADTVYVDSGVWYNFADDVKFNLRGTFVYTNVENANAYGFKMSDLYSNAFSFGLNIKNFDFVVAAPLAVVNGGLQYAYADYVDDNLGLNVMKHVLKDVDLSADTREVRFSGVYRHNFGEFTDGAAGVIYRVNPNNTDEFGNETILMMKLTHRLGI